MAKVGRDVLPRIPVRMNAPVGLQLIHGDHIRHIAHTAEQSNAMTRCRGHSRLFPVGIIRLRGGGVYPFLKPLNLSLFSGGVHHWDENGLRDGDREPKEIYQIHSEMIEFVKVWLKGWKV